MKKHYRIVLSDTGQIDPDSIGYIIHLYDQDNREHVLSVGAKMILSANSFHLADPDDEKNLDRINLDFCRLQEALERRSFTIASECESDMVRMDVLCSLAHRYAWFDGNIVDIPVVTDKVLSLMEMGVSLSDITLSVDCGQKDRYGKSAVYVQVANITHIENEMILQFSKSLDDLFEALENGDCRAAQRLSGIKGDLYEKLSLLGSRYAHWFYTQEGGAAG